MSESTVDNTPPFSLKENLGHAVDFSCIFDDGKKIELVGVDKERNIVSVGTPYCDVLLVEREADGKIDNSRWDMVSLIDNASGDRRVLSREWCKQFIQILGRTRAEWKEYSVNRLTWGLDEMLDEPLPNTNSENATQEEKKWIDELLFAGHMSSEESGCEEYEDHMQDGQDYFDEWKRNRF